MNIDIFSILHQYSVELIIYIGIAVLFGVILTFAWCTTQQNPLDYNLWLVQTERRAAQYRITRIISMAERTQLTFNNSLEFPQNNLEPIGVEEEDGERDITNLLVIQTPSTMDRNIQQIGGHRVERDSELSSSTTESPSTHQNLVPHVDDVQQHTQQIHQSENLVEQNTRKNTDCVVDSSAEVLTIRLKFLDDTQKLVQAPRNVSVGVFKREHFSEHLSAGKVVRLIFQGRLLRDDRSTLDSYGLTTDCVLHCHIGTRPYAPAHHQNQPSATDGNGTFQQNNGSNANANGPLNARMVASGFAWLDLVLLYAWNVILTLWEWSNRPVEVPFEQLSLLGKAKEYFRASLRVFLDILFGSAFRYRAANNQRQGSENRYNLGQLLALLIFVKFLLLWTIVLLYPQFTDRRSMSLLIVLTTTTGLYFYFNRANAPIQGRPPTSD